MERKIGEIFGYNGEWYQCVEVNDDANCSNCDIQGYCIIVKPNGFGRCLQWRSDNKLAIFKKLEKVGEPYMYGKVLMQTYRIFEKLYISPEVDENYEIIEETKDGLTISIELKQNKEDMEENKLNLKPFDLEAAKAGKPVCTRDGRKARIICFDTKGDVCPIIALVEENGIESSHHYDKNGENAYNKSELDLMMLPEKKEGWLNLYPVDDPRYAASAGCAYIYRTREQALSQVSKDTVATVKVEWEE